MHSERKRHRDGRGFGYSTRSGICDWKVFGASLLLVFLTAHGGAYATDNFVRVSLPKDVSIELPNNWVVISENLRTTLDSAVEARLDLSGIEQEGSELFFAANYYDDKGNTLGLLNVRYYPQLELTQADARSLNAQDVKELDAELKENIISSMKTFGGTVSHWIGTEKSTINDLTVFVTEYKRQSSKGSGVRVRLVRVLAADKSFTLTVSYHESASLFLKPITDKIINSLKLEGSKDASVTKSIFTNTMSSNSSIPENESAVLSVDQEKLAREWYDRNHIDMDYQQFRKASETALQSNPRYFSQMSGEIKVSKTLESMQRPPSKALAELYYNNYGPKQKMSKDEFVSGFIKVGTSDPHLVYQATQELYPLFKNEMTLDEFSKIYGIPPFAGEGDDPKAKAGFMDEPGFVGKSTIDGLYGDQWKLVLLTSFLFTWGVGLTPPLLIRFVFMHRPIGKVWAIVVVAIFLIFNHALSIALGNQSKTHSGLILIAVASYAILRKSAKKQVASAPTSMKYKLPDKEEPTARRKTR